MSEKATAEIIETTEGQVTNAYGLFMTAPTQAKYNYLIQFTASDWVMRIKPDATVELNEGVTLDEASAAFWDAVQFDGKTLTQRTEQAEKEAKRMREKIEDCRRLVGTQGTGGLKTGTLLEFLDAALGENEERE